MNSPTSNPAETDLSPVFDTSFYLKQIAASLANASDELPKYPIKHYIKTGWREGLDPHPWFDVSWYLARNPDVAAAGVEPLAHYLMHGWREDRQPHPRFDGTAYLASHPELLLANTCPLVAFARSSDGQSAPHPAPPPPASPQGWTSHFPAPLTYPYPDPAILSARIANYRAQKKPRNTIALYTCITQGYDTLRLPEHLSPEIDYFLFSDQPADGYGVFQVRPLQVIETNPTRASRHIKLLPHEHFADYDVAVWCDANVIISGDILPLLARFIASNLPLGMVPHPLRSCLYREGIICALTGKDCPEKIVAQMLEYQLEGFPENHGLIETNLFACRPRRPETRAFFSAWWAQLVNGSQRDQLSANYVLWKQGLTPFPLLGEGHNTRNHPDTALLDHGTADAGYYAAFATEVKSCLSSRVPPAAPPDHTALRAHATGASSRSAT